MKKWFYSKTVWFNVVSTIVTATAWALGELPDGSNAVVIIVFINTVGNMILRLLTNTKLVK